jgi:hypothetical protein
MSNSLSATSTASEPDSRRWLMLPVVLLAMFMAGFDIWVVNVAAPSLQRDLHVSDAALQLIVGGYAFMYASGMVTGGRLGDLVGYRRMFMIGVASFAVASLLCGLAQSPVELVGARLLQGLTGAAMVPQVLALITATFPAPERSRALAWFGVTMGLAFVSGQILGGLLLQADVLGLGWRAIFLVNVPIGLGALVVARLRLRESRDPAAGGVDVRVVRRHRRQVHDDRDDACCNAFENRTGIYRQRHTEARHRRRQRLIGRRDNHYVGQAGKHAAFFWRERLGRMLTDRDEAIGELLRHSIRDVEKCRPDTRRDEPGPRLKKETDAAVASLARGERRRAIEDRMASDNEPLVRIVRTQGIGESFSPHRHLRVRHVPKAVVHDR